MADEQKIFDGSSDDAGDADDDSDQRRLPILENDSEGAAAWLHRDRNGNAYLSVKLPLGIGSLNMFPSNDTVEDAMNQLADYLEEEMERG